MDLTVVIPARDAAATIGEQLDALTSQTWDGTWEVVVVDNGSTDATRAVVATRADPRIRLVDASERLGVAYCRNVGLAAAGADAIAMCDADDVVAPGWVAAMGDALRDHDFVTGALDVHRLNPPWLAESRGRAIEHGPGEFFGAFPFAHSCNLGVRREVARAVGGFDEHLPAGEDIELSFRLWRVGVPLTYVDDALVHYRYRSALGSLTRQAAAHGRVKPELVQMFTDAGVPIERNVSWRPWAWLARHAATLGSRSGRARWLWVAGTEVGRLDGALRLRAHAWRVR